MKEHDNTNPESSSGLTVGRAATLSIGDISRLAVKRDLERQRAGEREAVGVPRDVLEAALLSLIDRIDLISLNPLAHNTKQAARLAVVDALTEVREAAVSLGIEIGERKPGIGKAEVEIENESYGGTI